MKVKENQNRFGKGGGAETERWGFVVIASVEEASSRRSRKTGWPLQKLELKLPKPLKGVADGMTFNFSSSTTSLYSSLCCSGSKE
ncbi:uncharacterized protein LOC131162329 isoform X3 [Malania oleifera]|uniref:uncharacterized protein LOC131162329 isoform X3 n=1 Tax=Malania oleifera TaxID=397392 RepID=UPI0025ADB96B|nr:uncharacterized protein LOC131162329 isoform X3 [Malania oleifera]